MRTNTHITSSSQSAAKLALVIALAALTSSALGQQNPVPVQTAPDKVLQSPQEVLALIPDTIDTRPGGEWNAAAINMADKILQRVSHGKAAKLTFTTRVIYPLQNGHYSVLSIFAPLPEPYPYKVFYGAFFGPEETEALSKLAVGSAITVTGTLEDATLNYGNHETTLKIRIQGTGFVISSVAPTTGTATNRPALLPPGSRPLSSTPGNTTQKLILAQGWDTQMQGGSATIEDLGRVFGNFAQAGVNLAGDDSIVVYPGIPYLTPIRQALETLKPGTRMPFKVLLATSGFPRDSFYYYAIDGMFEGHFNRAYVVVDRADQVVSLQFVDEHPLNQSSNSSRDLGWHTYNFINDRSKSMNTLRIEHLPAVWANNRWIESSLATQRAQRPSTAAWNVIRLRSVLIQPAHPGRVGASKVLEEVQWYVPRPIVELIMTCVQKSVR